MEEETHTFLSEACAHEIGEYDCVFDWRPGTVRVLMQSVLVGNGTEGAKSYLLQAKSMELI
jgi:hypothetical protein